ncbi:MAG: hypothetical protein KJ066_02525 [Acidobacteria bacterium]|nr:hypothetical protein [Acidobacteriota bacterium]
MGATGVSFDVAPGHPGESAEAGKPADGAAVAPSGLEIQWLTRLNRAVQRATIYPAGHPLVAQAVKPVVEGLARLIDADGPVILHVSRHELVFVLRGRSPQAHRVPWLSSRLAARGVASLAVDQPLGPEEAATLVSWLASPPSDDANAPAIDGVEISWRDYSRARFTERRRAGTVAHDALLVWRDAVSDLAGEWWTGRAGAQEGGEPDLEHLLDDPQALAQSIRGRLVASEGTGLSQVTDRLFSLGGRLARLDESARVVVRRRLGALVTELAPELRGQLLRVVPHDKPEKVQLLAELVDELPSALVLEMLEHLEIGSGGASASFVGLLTRLGGVARHHPELEGALTRTLTRAGLPASVLDDVEQLQETLTELLAASPTDGTVSDDYRADLGTLGHAPAPVAIDEGRFLKPTRADDLVFGTSRIALTLLAHDADAPDAAALMRRAIDAAASALASGDLDYLGALAAVAVDGDQRPPEVRALAHEALALLQRGDVVDQVLDAALDPARRTSVHLGDLIRAGGAEAAARAVDRLAVAAAPAVRRRLVGLLVHVDPRVLANVLRRARSSSRLPGPALVALLGHEDMAEAPALAELFVTDEDASVRLQAYRIAFRGQTTAGRFERLAMRAVDDPDARVVVLALTEAQAREPGVVARVGGHLLCQPTAEANDRAQREAALWLAREGSPAARRALATALAARGGMWRTLARQVSRRMAAALDGFDDPPSRAAVRQWRRSPAGLLGWILGDAAGSTP